MAFKVGFPAGDYAIALDRSDASKRQIRVLEVSRSWLRHHHWPGDTRTLDLEIVHCSIGGRPTRCAAATAAAPNSPNPAASPAPATPASPAAAERRRRRPTLQPHAPAPEPRCRLRPMRLIIRWREHQQHDGQGHRRICRACLVATARPAA